MPYTYRRDDARRRLTITITGPLKIEEILESMDQQAADGRWNHAVLYNALARRGAAKTEGIRALVDHALSLSRAHGTRGPVAVVTNEPAQFGMGRVYGALIDTPGGSPFGVFMTVESAEKWLDEQQAPPGG